MFACYPLGDSRGPCRLEIRAPDADDYASNFADAHPPLNRTQALIEAERCYYCYDAPCQTACPTGIDIPSFIQRVAQDNVRGAAEAILTANPLGGMCARVCPTEVLCEQACVRNTNESKPVEIGMLQRYAVEGHFANPGARPLFERGMPTGRRIAVVGAGPAGLACGPHPGPGKATRSTLLDANAKPGGPERVRPGAATKPLATLPRSEDGLAAEHVGGISLPQLNWRLQTADITLAEPAAPSLTPCSWALAWAAPSALNIARRRPGTGWSDAVAFIARAAAERTRDLASLPVGRQAWWSLAGA